MNQRILRGVVFVLAAAGLTSCNLYGGIDHPSGDLQLISAARAAFNQGDYATALSYYQQVSNNSSDIELSESAYVTYDQAGATMQAYASAFGNGKNSSTNTITSGLTTMANSILAQGAGQTARVAIYNAFMGYKNITDNTGLSATVEFLGAIAFASEILAEVAVPFHSNTLTNHDMSSNTSVACTGTPASGTLLSAVSLSTVQSAATLDLFNAALENISDAISRLTADGSFATGFSSAINDFLGSPPNGAGGCSLSIGTTVYTQALATLGVGGQ